MAQTRAVLPARFVPLADELLATTGANDYSTLIGILLSRYGKHLLNTWEIANCPQAWPYNSRSPNCRSNNPKRLHRWSFEHDY
jgi:hypothetical protein